MITKRRFVSYGLISLVVAISLACTLFSPGSDPLQGAIQPGGGPLQDAIQLNGDPLKGIIQPGGDGLSADVQPASLTPPPIYIVTATASPPPTATATITPTPTPHPMNILAMRQTPYPGSDIVIEGTFDRGANYSRYYAWYLSEGLKIYGLLTIPDGEMPPTGWPAIVFNHG